MSQPDPWATLARATGGAGLAGIVLIFAPIIAMIPSPDLSWIGTQPPLEHLPGLPVQAAAGHRPGVHIQSDTRPLLPAHWLDHHWGLLVMVLVLQTTYPAGPWLLASSDETVMDRFRPT